MSVKERELGMHKIEEKTITYGNGFVIENVPHVKRIELIDNEEFISYSVKGKISLILSVITEYMESSGNKHFDFSLYDKVEPVQTLLQNYLRKYELI